MTTMLKPILLIMVTACFSAVQGQPDPDFLFMVGQAVKAPSGHNTQPWLFRINQKSIEIHPDFSKKLPVVDPSNRELFISLGCALENLCIAASIKGYSTDVGINPDGIITVELSYPNISAAYNTLFLEIPRRQSNRGAYSGKVIPADTLDAIEKFILQEGIDARLYGNGTNGFLTIKHFIERGNRIQMRNKDFKNELKSWMRFNKKHSELTSDGLAYDVFGAPNLPMFISKPAMNLAINEKRQVKSDGKKIDSSSHLVLFTLKDDSVPEWILLGRQLQRFLLKTTSLGLTNAFMNQPNEVPELAGEMVRTLALDDRIPAIILRIGYADSMPYSRRKGLDYSLLSD